jgi:hypothetical protein
MKLEFSQQILEKSSRIKLHETPSNGNRVARADGQTYRIDQANSLFFAIL